LPPALLTPQVTDGAVCRETMQPGTEAAVAAKTADLSPQQQECFLGSVLSQDPAPGHAQAQAVDLGQIALIQAMEGRLLSGLHLANQHRFTLIDISDCRACVGDELQHGAPCVLSVPLDARGQGKVYMARSGRGS